MKKSQLRQIIREELQKEHHLESMEEQRQWIHENLDKCDDEIAINKIYMFLEKCLGITESKYRTRRRPDNNPRVPSSIEMENWSDEDFEDYAEKQISTLKSKRKNSKDFRNAADALSYVASHEKWQRG